MEETVDAGQESVRQGRGNEGAGRRAGRSAGRRLVFARRRPAFLRRLRRRRFRFGLGLIGRCFRGRRIVRVRLVDAPLSESVFFLRPIYRGSSSRGRWFFVIAVVVVAALFLCRLR